MSVEKPKTGTREDRPGVPQPDRGGDSLGKVRRELEQVGTGEAEDAVQTRGRQPGAHGNDTPHRNVKPGTRDALEDVDD